MSAWWGTRSNVSPRLHFEVEAMRALFDHTFKLIVPEQSDLLYWKGTVELNMEGLSSPFHTLKILYPRDYPNRPAEAYVLKPTIVSNKHQYTDGQLCLFNPKDGEHYGWNPSNSTAVTIAGWSIEWLYAYYTWRSTKVWPGIEEQIDPNDRRR